MIQGWIDQGRLAPVEPLHLILLIWSVTQHYADFEPQIDALHDGDAKRLFDGAESTLRLLLTNGLARGTSANDERVDDADAVIAPPTPALPGR